MMTVSLIVGSGQSTKPKITDLIFVVFSYLPSIEAPQKGTNIAILRPLSKRPKGEELLFYSPIAPKKKARLRLARVLLARAAFTLGTAPVDFHARWWLLCGWLVARWFI